jgi:hypothetical protein
MNRLLLLSSLYIATVVGLFIYSFTQIDLGLAFSRNEQFQAILKVFQQVGYFDRPLSAGLYIGLVILLSAFYGIFLFLAYKKKLKKSFVWKLILITTVILTFSYNAFSYDLFNYIFDAKIVTAYQQNPYVHKALDYPNDPMLAFMRWTHRVYPYGPLWLGMTIPISFVGMQIFTVTFFLFKIGISASFVGSVYFIGKILQKLKPDREVFGLVFFGLSPLVLIESVVSAHLDIVMMFFALWAFYFLIHRKYIRAFTLLVISIGIKFATVFLMPVFIMLVYWQVSERKIYWDRLLFLASMLMGGAVLAASLRSTFQPWYLVELLAFAALLSYRYYILVPCLIISFFALGTYVPYLYVGNWDGPIPQYLMALYISSYLLAGTSVGFLFFANKNKQAA